MQFDLCRLAAEIERRHQQRRENDTDRVKAADQGDDDCCKPIPGRDVRLERVGVRFMREGRAVLFQTIRGLHGGVSDRVEQWCRFDSTVYEGYAWVGEAEGDIAGWGA